MTGSQGTGMQHRSIGQKLIKLHDLEEALEVVDDWAKEMRCDLLCLADSLADAFLQKQKGTFFDRLDVLKADLEKRLGAIPRVTRIVAEISQDAVLSASVNRVSAKADKRIKSAFTELLPEDGPKKDRRLEAAPGNNSGKSSLRRTSINWDQVPELGKVFDTVLAARLGVSHTAVAKARKARGLPAVARKKRVNWKRWEPLLGTMEDIDLAGRMGCDRSTVTNRRRTLGIPRFRSMPQEP